MLFYKVEGMLAMHDDVQEDNRRANRELARKFNVKTEEFNEKYQGDPYCFVAGTTEGLMTVGLITTQAQKVSSQMERFLKCLDCQLKDVTFSETTIANFQQMLRRAERLGFIDDAEDIGERFGFNRLVGRHGHGIEFGENIIESCDRKDIEQKVDRYLMNETMLPELDRIYAGSPKGKFQGHPVHYVVQTDSADTRREVCRLLLGALHANDRLTSRRYCFLNFRPGEQFSLMAFDVLYQLCTGGSIIVRYFPNDDTDNEGFANSEQDTIERICQVAKRYRNQVLTIVCLPRECKQVKSLFYENLGTMTMVEVREEFSSFDQAKDFLKLLAKDNHVRTDKVLFSGLDPEKGYLAVDLHRIFDEWFNAKLKNTIFPQYKDLQSVRQETVKAAPKGSAYDDLQQMVGLTEAKAVIRKALNYYKMQKLYEQRGMKSISPAMHMVFTGNPGTAKTTAARLFARIMKDNGLLSRGQLVEVGRGDLVGKYVGWTAQLVQAKFKEAKGGVLFIDEAYSLVDDRSGSYGDEAINTIVQEMENHRHDVVVIFAGYPDEMEKFLQKNPGLRSRIAFHVPFADYNAEELCQIAELMGKNQGVCFEKDALTKLGTAFETARKQKDFGNGRYVRNLLEQAKMNQASRLLEYDFEEITTEQIKTIKAVDVVIPQVTTEGKRTIGFAC